MEFVHEPGSTELGWRVRDILKRGLSEERTISDRAELLLFSGGARGTGVQGRCDRY